MKQPVCVHRRQAALIFLPVSDTVPGSLVLVPGNLAAAPENPGIAPQAFL